MAKIEIGDTVHFECSDSLITCQICMEIFESPRILPCQHTFCKECIISLLKKHCIDEDGNGKGDSFPCPNCRKKCKINQKENLSIEEHLQRFPESLLQKTLLDSINDKGNGKETELQKRCVRCIISNSIHEQSANEIGDDTNLLLDHTIRSSSDAQTQTEDYNSVVNLFEVLLVTLLTKNVFSVAWLSALIFQGQKWELNIFLLSSSLLFRLETFLEKSFRIFLMIYFEGYSFSWSILLCMVSYVVLLVSFKRIKTYIDGGVHMGFTRPLFPLFLINLNCIENMIRWYTCSRAILQLDLWVLLKMALLEAVPGLVFLTVISITMIYVAYMLRSSDRNTDV